MPEFISQHLDTILIVGGVVVAAFLLFCVIKRLFRLAIGVAVLVLVVPVIFTIFWGDGSTYVSKFASIFNPKYQTKIEEMYQYYKEKDAEDPFVDYDAVKTGVSDTLSDVFSHFSEKE